MSSKVELRISYLSGTFQSLPKLLYMRRRGKDENVDMLSRPGERILTSFLSDLFSQTQPLDIRTLYILFLLSFIDSTASTSIKIAFLEQRRDLFVSIFKGLAQDSSAIIRRVLEVCWVGLWSDPKVKRTLKVNIFNETILIQLLRLYDRATPEGDDAQDVPADIVHHFLLAICTHPGVGVCFRDKGWYPRETDLDDRLAHDDADVDAENTTQARGKIHNRILANLLKSVKVNEDSRQQELAIKIFEACPELVAG